MRDLARVRGGEGQNRVAIACDRLRPGVDLGDLHGKADAIHAEVRGAAQQRVAPRGPHMRIGSVRPCSASVRKRPITPMM